MNTFKEECVRLREEGRSLSEIMALTGRPKSSVYAHIHSIPLAEKRIIERRIASGNHIRKYALARKGKSARSFNTISYRTSNGALLLGHLMFDGSITRGKVVYNNRSRELILRVENLMREVYEYEPKRWTNADTGVLRISYHNVALGHYLQLESRKLLRHIHELPRDAKRAFLRAFFDDEGCIDYRPEHNRRSIRGYQKDVRILMAIQRLLSDFLIQSRIVLPNEVVITGRVDLDAFEREIGFSPGVSMNGNRLNSRWKKETEKRALLRQAISSYKT